MNEMYFVLPVEPRAQPRPRFGVVAGHARAFAHPQGVRDQDTIIALAAPHAPTTPLEGPLHVRLDMCLPVPASWPAWKRTAALAQAIRPTGKPDADNAGKLVLDALTRSGRWWRDDAQVVDLHVTKSYSATPATCVWITEDHDIASAAEWKAQCAKEAMP